VYFYEENGSGYKLTLDPETLTNITFYDLSRYNYTLDNETIDVLPGAGISKSITIDISAQDDEIATLFAINSAVIAIDHAQQSIGSLSASADLYYNYTTEEKVQFDQAFDLLTQVNEMLELDIKSTEEYSLKIDSATQNIEKIQEEMNSSLSRLTRLQPSLAEKLVTPILQNFEPVISDIDNITLAFPGMLAIIIIFISILFSNIVTLAEINSKAFYRNMIAPVSSLIFIFGLIITNILIVSIQISVLLLVGQFQFRIDLFQRFLPIFAIISLLAMFFICIGMIAAVMLKNPQTSILTTTFLALGFFLFSDAVAPLETMPALAAAFAAKNPFVIATAAFKKIIIFNLPGITLLNELSTLGVYLLVALICLVIVSMFRLKINQ
jgi:ABC-type multidrug transport system permease subunit